MLASPAADAAEATLVTGMPASSLYRCSWLAVSMKSSQVWGTVSPSSSNMSLR